MSDYDRIAKAIKFISENVAVQPKLEDIAAHVHMSPFHFQRLFCRWAGTTPKRLLQVLTLERSKQLMNESASLLDLSNGVGLSSGSRLHDHFVHLEAVTPGEYKNQGKGLRVKYGVHPTPFGTIFIAVTQRGVCRAAFLDSGDASESLTELEDAWPLATLVRNNRATQHAADAIKGVKTLDRPLSLHVSGTNFQIAVWRALLTIPQGAVVSYSRIASALDRPRSSRAVGSAIAANPVAFLIPCHRVILSDGALGQYRWGQARKQAIQVWERARLEANTT